MSIQQSYLDEIASRSYGDISKVVINELYEIDHFQIKELTSSHIILSYTVPFDLVTNITRIELKKSNNEAISTHAVYIPVTADTVIKQELIFKNKG